MADRTQYRYRGTDRRGADWFGTSEYGPGEMAAEVEKRFRQGWRELRVCRGPGPVPPAADEPTVAEITPRYGRQPRAWYAEK